MEIRTSLDTFRNKLNQCTSHILERQTLSEKHLALILLAFEMAIDTVKTYEQQLKDIDEKGKIADEDEAYKIAFHKTKLQHFINYILRCDWVKTLPGKLAAMPQTAAVSEKEKTTIEKTNDTYVTETKPTLAKRTKKPSIWRRLFCCTAKEPEPEAEPTLTESKNAASETTTANTTASTQSEKKVDDKPQDTNDSTGEFERNYIMRIINPKQAKYDDYIKNLNAAKKGQARKYATDLIAKKKCLWDSSADTKLDSFSNLFLVQLRHTNINAYRKLIGKRYWVKFAKGERHLFRGDSRDKSIIFDEGFKLVEATNNAATRKCRYTNSINGSVGVSMSSRKWVANSFGHGRVYKIHLPANHRLLIADIRYKTPMKAELNSLDDIPREYIVSVIEGGVETPNPNYKAEPDFSSPKIQRGCY